MLQISDLACRKDKDARRHAGADTGAGDAAQCWQSLGAPTERRLSKIAHPHINVRMGGDGVSNQFTLAFMIGCTTLVARSASVGSSGLLMSER
jgi:hypothetical protein